ncbi:peptidase inhibitor family I36 protein [Streptomyces sp. NPDC020422]|uniref:peptidase inhibitor family I36 protein n=1 Tax=unclassified Streptomyces TaxID=2593676 RepID=UPI0036F7BA38
MKRTTVKKTPVKKSLRLTLGLAAVAVAVAGSLTAPGSAGAAAPLDPWSCTPGAFCVYSGADGTGKACGWQVDDPDWRKGSTVCAWSKDTRVRSARNRGSSGAPVAAFTRVGYAGTKAFCLASGRKINLPAAGTYLASHTWAC